MATVLGVTGVIIGGTISNMPWKEQATNVFTIEDLDKGFFGVPFSLLFPDIHIKDETKFRKEEGKFICGFEQKNIKNIYLRRKISCHTLDKQKN